MAAGICYSAYKNFAKNIPYGRGAASLGVPKYFQLEKTGFGPTLVEALTPAWNRMGA